MRRSRLGSPGAVWRGCLPGMLDAACLKGHGRRQHGGICSIHARPSPLDRPASGAAAQIGHKFAYLALSACRSARDNLPLRCVYWPACTTLPPSPASSSAMEALSLPSCLSHHHDERISKAGGRPAVQLSHHPVF